MSILVDRSTRVLVQGITGREGTFHTEQMQAYGTDVVAGVVPGRGGAVHLGVPVFDTVAEAVTATDGLRLFAPPETTVVCFAADGVDLFVLADELADLDEAYQILLELNEPDSLTEAKLAKLTALASRTSGSG